jgi:hypothetical protein
MSKPSERVIRLVERRLQEHVRKKWSGKVKSLSVRSRGAFVYVDAELVASGQDGDEDDDREQPVCRLRYLGSDDQWEFAFFSWSRGLNGGYELSYLNNGQPVGSPEECFDCAAFPWR